MGFRSQNRTIYFRKSTMGLNREIKYRTWQENKMYFHELCNYLGSTGIVNPYIGCDKAIWMQFTGLKDKNGIEIYEWDIVSISRSGFLEGNFENIVCYVIWDKLYAHFRLQQKTVFLENGEVDENYGYYDHYNFTFPSKIEVIGNIYENLELLTQPFITK